ncbi:ATP-binding protein [Methanocella sp. MCL-LM]|uniref:ATP-binding protein n=1 Tax=Methanocella sp. MCL-LM TaxID=3412035 RepID=UPI003C744EC5
MSIETVGNSIDKIEVKISYRIIELFSAGLYSSPNKAFEELVCNSYDAFADKVSVYVPSDLSTPGAFIWVCDNGTSMDQQGLKDLWNIGKSLKRIDPKLDAKRLQIGRFGIGKLATYVLANKLTFICKKDNKYLATTMDYSVISDKNEEFILDEREIDAKTAEEALSPYIYISGKYMVSFDLFGKNAVETWTIAILTELTGKAQEIKEGRLKWVLRTALPLNPSFKLYYNNNEIESSKINKPIRRSWTIGKDDEVADSLDFATAYNIDDKYYIDFDNLKGIYGQIDLYEDTLLDESKSSGLGRSHGIFLMVRGRLVNIDDPLLGMDPLSHGAFNRIRILIYADELDNNLTSTRESIKDSKPLQQLKAYILNKFNEVRRYYVLDEDKKTREKNLTYRLSQTSLTVSKRPLYAFAEKYFNEEIINPLLIEKPPIDIRSKLLDDLKQELLNEDPYIKKVEWCEMGSGEPIGKLDLSNGVLKINMFHPYIVSCSDAYKKLLPIEFIVITEVLTEAHLYEIGLDDSQTNEIMRWRDTTLRELSLSDRESALVIALLLKDSLADPTGLEDALYRAFLSLGFEVKKIGGNGEPDGKADAVLGYINSVTSENYSLTYDAKSTSKPRIQASTANIAVVKKHQEKYKADYSVVISTNYDGADDPESSICSMAKQQKVTVIKAKDLLRLLYLSAPKQIGLKKLRGLFDTCHAPYEVTAWIDAVEKEEPLNIPIEEIFQVIYELQRDDREAPDISVIRYKLNSQNGKVWTLDELMKLLGSLKNILSGFITFDNNKVAIHAHPDKLMAVMRNRITSVPTEIQQMYLSAFSLEK